MNVCSLYYVIQYRKEAAVIGRLERVDIAYPGRACHRRRGHVPRITCRMTLGIRKKPYIGP